MPEVEKFKSYYQNTDNSPVTIDSLYLTVTTTGIDIKTPVLPVSPFLVQSYPNPFNPATTIQVETLTIGKLDLFIYNLRGKRIRSITTDDQIYGIQKFLWDAKNDQGDAVATGQYFVEVIFENVQTAKRYSIFGNLFI